MDKIMDEICATVHVPIEERQEEEDDPKKIMDESN